MVDPKRAKAIGQGAFKQSPSPIDMIGGALSKMTGGGKKAAAPKSAAPKKAAAPKKMVAMKSGKKKAKS